MSITNDSLKQAFVFACTFINVAETLTQVLIQLYQNAAFMASINAIPQLLPFQKNSLSKRVERYGLER